MNRYRWLSVEYRSGRSELLAAAAADDQQACAQLEREAFEMLEQSQVARCAIRPASSLIQGVRFIR